MDDSSTGKYPLGRPQRRRRLFPLSSRTLRDERGLVRALSLPGIAIALIAAAVALIFSTSTYSVRADHSGTVSGNPTCATVSQGASWTEFKIDDSGSEMGLIHALEVGQSVDFSIPGTNAEIRITLVSKKAGPPAEALSFSWSTNAATTGAAESLPIDAILVKGGPDGAQLYHYDPEATSGGPLTTPGGSSGISHITICYDADPAPDPDIDVSKDSTPDTTVAAGGAVAWNVTITVADGPASGTVTDTVPAGFVIGTVTEPANDAGNTISCSTNLQVVTCTLTETPTGSYVVVINTTAPDGDPRSECTTHQNSVQVTGDDIGPDGNSDTDDIEVTCAPLPDPDIDVSKNSTPETTVSAGGEVAWNVTITVADGPASGTVTDTVPAGFAIGTVTEPANDAGDTISCSVAAQVVTCTLTETPTGSYVVVINTTAPDGDPRSECTTHQNSVQVTGDDIGPDGNSATDDIEVTCAPLPDPDIDVSKNSTPDTTVAAGGAVAWNVTITVADGPASGTVTDTVPAGFAIGTVTEPANDLGDTISCSVAAQVVTCTLTETPTGSYVVVINTTAPDGDPRSECTTHQNSVQVTGDDIGPDGNSATDDIEVTCAPIAPDLQTAVSVSSIDYASDDEVTDTATLPPDATGTVTFYLCGPTTDPENCASETNQVGGAEDLVGGKATSDPVSPEAVGWYCFLAKYTPDAQSPQYLATSHTNTSSECFQVAKIAPRITTTASPSGIVAGQTVTDTANLPDDATGSVEFFLCGPLLAAADCNDGESKGSKTLDGEGDATSDPITLNQVGVYCFRVVYTPDASSPYLTGSHTNNDTECVTVRQAQPGISTTPTPTIATIGDAISDTANLTGVNPTGTILFSLFPPSDPNCDGAAVYTSTVTVNGNGIYDSDDGDPVTGTNVTNAVGTWRWTAVYSGDANNAGATSGCDEELVEVGAEPTGIITVFKVCDPDNIDATFTFDLFQDGGDTAIQTKDVTCAEGQVQFDGLTGDHTYVVEERDHPDWTEDDSDCADLALDPANDVRSDECTITNSLATISILKVCDIDLGQTFDIYVGGQLVADDIECGGTVGPIPFPVGTHVVRETLGDGSGIAGIYDVSFSVDCTGGTITPVLGENRRCTVTNELVPVDPAVDTEAGGPGLDVINLTAGGSITDTATFTPDSNLGDVEGTVTFFVCFDANAIPDCDAGGVTLLPVPSNPATAVAITNNEAVSPAYTPTQVGFYCFFIDFQPAQDSFYAATTHTNQDSECFRAVDPDTDVEKTDSPDPVLAGEELTYTIVVTNNGSGATTGVITTVDQLPDGLTAVTVTENGWDCDDEAIAVPTSGAILTCTYDGVVEAGADAPTITVVVTVPESCDNLENTVTVSGPDAQDDVDEPNNTDTETTDVDGCDADLDITKSGDTVALIGDEIEYLIEVFNDGNHAAEDVVVTDNLDDSLEDVSAFWDDDNDPSAGGTACDVNAGNVVVCDMGDLPAGESRWVLITATVDDCDDLVNQATVDWTDPGDEPEPDDDTDESNASNVVTTAVTCGSITIVKDTDPETDGIDFEFISDFGPFELEDGQIVVFDDLEPDTYSVTESDLPEDWDLTFIDCTNDDAGLAVDVDVDGNEVEINLRAGENVTCLFNNVFTPPPPPPPPPVTTTDDEEPPVIVVPQVSPPLVDEVQGVRATPRPQATPGLISEVLTVRRLPTTGTGGPTEDGSTTPWVLVAAASTLAALGALVAIGRRRQNQSR